MTCNCASNRVVCITRLPSASLLAKKTSEFPLSTSSSDGGAIDTASLRKFVILVPNLRRASSAASSAFSISLSRFAASARNRATMPVASLTISCGRLSGRSGCAGSVELEASAGVSLSPLSAPSGVDVGSGFVWEREIPRVRVRRSLIPFEAVLLATVYSF